VNNVYRVGSAKTDTPIQVNLDGTHERLQVFIRHYRLRT
jgi:hypothetical protein